MLFNRVIETGVILQWVWHRTEDTKLEIISVVFYIKKFRDKEKEMERMGTRGEAGLSCLEVTEAHPNSFK